MSKPSNICLTLATLHRSHWSPSEPGWLTADEIRGVLCVLGFKATAQQVGSWLKACAALSHPPIEVRKEYGYNSYRVTTAGETWLHNTLPDIWFAQRRSYDRLMATSGEKQS